MLFKIIPYSFPSCAIHCIAHGGFFMPCLLIRPRLSHFWPPSYFPARPHGSDFLTPYLKKFCASEPARLGLRPSSTFRGRGRSDFARAGEGAGAFGVIFGLAAGAGSGLGCLFCSRWWWAAPAWCGGCCPVSRLAAPGCCSCCPSACWRLALPWACMSAPHRPRPHRPQPPRRRPAAHGSGSHHATPARSAAAVSR